MNVEAYDPDDPQHVDQVAKGAHVGKLVSPLLRYCCTSLIQLDITIGTIANFVTRLLTPEQQSQYLSPMYRIRVVK